MFIKKKRNITKDKSLNKDDVVTQKYVFYKDKRMMAIIFLIIVIIMQIVAYVQTPVLTTIHAYTVGFLFGQFNPVFYFYCFYISLTQLFKTIKFGRFIRFTKYTYWFFFLALMLTISTWFYYLPKTGATAIGTEPFKSAFSSWWETFSTSTSWAPTSVWGGVIGALIYSILASFTTTIGAAIIATILTLTSFSLLLTGTWIGLYRNIMKFKSKTKDKGNNENENSLVSKKTPFIDLPEPPTDEESKFVSVKAQNFSELPFEDLTSDPAMLLEEEIINIQTKHIWAPYPKIGIDKLSQTEVKYPQYTYINLNLTRDFLNNLFTTHKIEAHVSDLKKTRQTVVYNIKFKNPLEYKKIEMLKSEIEISLNTKLLRFQYDQVEEWIFKIITEGQMKPLLTFKEIYTVLDHSALSFKIPIGKDINDEIFFIDFTKIPNWLIAGKTHTGKSNLIHLFITWIIMNYSPENIRFILIDTKVVEFNVYYNLPHLLTPLITEPATAANRLERVVKIIAERYRIMRQCKVKTIREYNKLAKIKNWENFYSLIIVIEDFNDLFLVASQSVHQSIVQITQRGKAVGVHVIISTKEINTQVLSTNLLANITGRVALAVKSKIHSKIILNDFGAEYLINNGDCFIRPGHQPLERIQLALLTNQEIQTIVHEVMKYGKPRFNLYFLHDTNNEEENDDDILIGNKQFEGY